MNKLEKSKLATLSQDEMHRINGGDDRPYGRRNYDSPTPTGGGSGGSRGGGSNNSGWMYLLWYAMGQAMS